MIMKKFNNNLNSYQKATLFLTVDSKFSEKILEFLNNKAQVNEKNITGRTALAWVMKKDNLDMTKLLIEHDTQIDNVDYHERSSLIWAVKNDDKLSSSCDVAC